MTAPYAVEMLIMAVRQCSLAQAHAEYADVEPLIIALQHEAPIGHGTVTAQALNLRENPTINSAKAGVLVAGAAVEIWGKAQTKSEGVWLCIRAGELAGWVSAQWIKET